VIPILAGLALILAAILRRPRRRQWTPPISTTECEIFETEMYIADSRLVGILDAESRTRP
jgi:hypothetical protein